MDPFTLAVLCVGISLSARIVKFITGEITENEKRKCQELKDKVNSLQGRFKEISQSFQSDADALNKEHAAQMTEARKRFQAELEKQEQIYQDQHEYRKNYRKQRQQDADRLIKAEAGHLKQSALAQQESLIQQMVSMLKERSDERIKENDELIHDLKDTISKLKGYKKEQCTEMRKNAFKLLEQELRTGLSKAKAYEGYLRGYQHVLERLCQQQSDELVFSFQLPQHYPYFGAIIQLSDAELQQIHQNNGWCYLYFHGLIRRRIYVKNQIRSQIGQSFFVEDFDDYLCNGEAVKAFGVSADKAAYFLCKRSGCFTGLPAVVTGYDRLTKDVFLRCGESMKLRMRQQNLLNSAHYPAIRSEIVVYPLEEYFHRNEGMRYYVTQRFEDTEISLTFHEIPVMIPQDKLIMFCKFFRDYNIYKEYDDAKIAPDDENNFENNRVKIQFQDAFLIRAVIQRHSSGTMYFKFEDFPDPSEGIHAENIFVSFHAVIKMYDQEELNDLLEHTESLAVRDEMTHLVMTVFREFQRQKELKAADGGSRYFQAWEQLTSQLKEFLTAGNSVMCMVKSFPYVLKTRTGDILFRYPIVNCDDLRKYYERQCLLNKSNCSLYFFMQWNAHRLNITIHPDFESVTVVLPKIYIEQDDAEMELRQLTEILIYKLELCVPEQRQLTSLYLFKTGRMANGELHLFALNAASIHSEQSEQTEINKIILKNNSLKADASQYSALTGALREKNWFMIQGPPGTGKTTVIRELIWQTLQIEPRAKILVVSQANVAVDNVLRGLLKAGCPNSMILRCGWNGKIAEDIRPVSYETKLQSYLDQVEQKSSDGDLTAMTWLDILGHSSQKNADLGNLLMLSHQIIGATCVGLAQKNIGLENATFDLVIVDEAGKALMPEVLIPMNKAKKLILIGDHKQLPPVIHPALYDPELIELDDRNYFKKEVFDTSFFEREFLSCPESNKTILTTQYRMPTMIGTMISSLFYNGQIKNGSGTEKKMPLYFDTSISLIDMSEISAYREDENGSPTNDFEARYVLFLVQEIRKKNPNIRIAVIMPYKGQKRRVINLFAEEMRDYVTNQIAIDTVDSFQGDEAEIVIYCTTRARRKTRFFSDYRRLNVAFSRAKNELIILASAKYLEQYAPDEPIHRVLEYLRNKKCIRKPVKIRLKMKKDSALHTVPIESIFAKEICSQESIENEITYYQDKGKFSYIPTATMSDGKYLILEGSSIYYASYSMGLDNLTVKVRSVN